MAILNAYIDIGKQEGKGDLIRSAHIGTPKRPLLGNAVTSFCALQPVRFLFFDVTAKYSVEISGSFLAQRFPINVIQHHKNTATPEQNGQRMCHKVDIALSQTVKSELTETSVFQHVVFNMLSCLRWIMSKLGVIRT